MPVAPVLRRGLDGMPHRVAEVEHLAASGVALVRGHRGELCAYAPEDGVLVHLATRANPRPQRSTGDQGRLHDLRVSRGALLWREGLERSGIADDGGGLVVCTGVVLALREVDARLAAIRRIHLRDEGRGHLHEAHPALVDRGTEAG